jgi:DNA-binding beta-propeller fold protein YncE
MVMCVAMSTGLASCSSASSDPHDLHLAISVPSVMTALGARIWLANTGNSSVLVLDATTGDELADVTGKQYGLDDPDAMAAYGGDVWASDYACDCVTEFRQRDDSLIRLLGAAYHFENPIGLVAAERHVFVLNQAGSRIAELSAATGLRVGVLAGARFHFDGADAMVTNAGDVWVASRGGTLTEIRASTGALVRVVGAGAARLDEPDAMADDGGDLWILNGRANHVSVVSAVSGRLVRTISTKHVAYSTATSIVLVDHRLWIASTADHAFVDGINATTGALVQAFPHRFGYPSVFPGDNHVWIVDREQSRVTELDAVNGAVIRVVTN